MHSTDSIKRTYWQSVMKKEEIYQTLLSYRATPIDHHLKSPAELLTNRKFRTNCYQCPTVKALQLIRGKLRSSWRGSRTAIVTIITEKRKAGLTLKPLHPGQPVWILDYHIKTWEPGTVLRAAKEPWSKITPQKLYTNAQDHTSGQTQ